MNVQHRTTPWRGRTSNNDVATLGNLISLVYYFSFLTNFYFNHAMAWFDVRFFIGLTFYIAHTKQTGFLYLNPFGYQDECCRENQFRRSSANHGAVPAC